MGRRGNRLLWRTLAWGTYNPGTEVSPGAGDLRALLEGRPVVGGGSEPIRSLLAPGAIPHAPGLLHYAAGAGLHVLLYRTSRFDLEESRRRTPILGTALACRVPAVGESSRGIRRWYRPDGALRRRKAAAGADLASVCPALRADAHASRPDPLRVELLRLPLAVPHPGVSGKDKTWRLQPRFHAPAPNICAGRVGDCGMRVHRRCHSAEGLGLVGPAADLSARTGEVPDRAALPR